MSPPESPRQRVTKAILAAAALELFAERGFAGTTVGDIEAAVGLTPRAGGFYRHFKSKEEALEAAVEAHVAGLGELERLGELLPLGDARAELTLAGRWALRFLGAQGPLIRLLMRDGDAFPELQARVHERLIAAGYEEARTFFASLCEREGRALPDLDALVAIAVGAIVHHVEDRVRFGAPPGGASEERFLATWVELMARFFEGQNEAETSR